MLRAIAAAEGGHWPSESTTDHVTLDFDRRHRRRLRMTTEQGLDLLLDLPKALPLADGDGLQTTEGSWIEVRAAAEPVLEIRARDAQDMIRFAWHLGNRHIPAQLLESALRIRPDHVIAEMIEGLGGEVRSIEAAFQPESGAYARHAHGSPEPRDAKELTHHHGHANARGSEHAHEH